VVFGETIAPMLEKLVMFVGNEWRVLSKAPFSFVMLASLALGLGFGGGKLYYASQIGSVHEQLTEKNSELGRYRVALGIDPASRGALVELNNEELGLRAQVIVGKLRDLSLEFDKSSKAVKEQRDAGKISDKELFDNENAIMKEVSEDFDRNLASDADNMRNELRKRLSPEAISHIIRVPALLAGDGTNTTSIPFTALFKGSGFAAVYIGGLADEIEEMAKLLPPDSRRP
jgi:hypothetical protein